MNESDTYNWGFIAYV